MQSEIERLGVQVELNHEFDSSSLPNFQVVIQATGAQRGVSEYEITSGTEVLDIAEIRRGNSALPETGVVVILDPIGGPIGVALAEELGERAILVTPDNIAGNEL